MHPCFFHPPTHIVGGCAVTIQVVRLHRVLWCVGGLCFPVWGAFQVFDKEVGVVLFSPCGSRLLIQSGNGSKAAIIHGTNQHVVLDTRLGEEAEVLRQVNRGAKRRGRGTAAEPILSPPEFGTCIWADDGRFVCKCVPPLLCVIRFPLWKSHGGGDVAWVGSSLHAR